MSDLLSRFPRVPLADLPTPLHEAPRLTETLGGPRVLVKRDDATGLALGGNKTRKLEFLLGRALAEGHDTVVTFGAVQSNHARQTAAACARLGLRCELVLTRSVPRPDALYETSGNVLLDGLLGARTHIVDGADEALALLAEIGPAYAIPPGGSDATGALGYVAAGLEFAAQAADLPGGVDRIVVATSTAGTTAGLALGLAHAGLDTAIEAVCVYEPAGVTAATLDAVLGATADLLGAPLPERRPRVHGDWFGPGYGVPTPEMVEAVRLFARTEGILLDPVYTGKAAAGLAGLARTGAIGPDETVVFWHTGGAPGLFVYPDALTGAGAS
ncbi:D-cysteine desulfhydrase family protein [Actinomadura parmotrematis]|uniref:D-cysteine desulfhydrase family protein n=1 Tax=Actinomadura parmotrematis TaxID=2864039 RepID=A0ABS7FXY6_9ACTN|nr:D-cysteine desulfhydrase family protein [Actinomadura parmotrematis]MBW8484313.1 D-cysteine desulfhydrase family protein [Actinomadura parmotrematis]